MMKKTNYLIFTFLLLSIGTFAQNGEIIDVEAFNTLTVKGSFNVVLHTGEPYLHFKSGDGSDVLVENKNGILSVTSKNGTDILHDLHIGSPGFKNINITIDGDFTVNKSSISFSTLNFNANIKGETKLNLNGAVFVGNFNNCGKVTITGTVDNIYSNLSNTADLNTTNLKAGSSSINHKD